MYLIRQGCAPALCCAMQALHTQHAISSHLLTIPMDAGWTEVTMPCPAGPFPPSPVCWQLAYLITAAVSHRARLLETAPDSDSREESLQAAQQTS